MEKPKNSDPETRFDWQANARASRGKWVTHPDHRGRPTGSPLLLYAPFDDNRGSWLALDRNGLRAGHYGHRPGGHIDTATFYGEWDLECSWPAGLQLMQKQTGQTF